MPPTDRLVPRYAAEPPQEGLPYGRWAERLDAEWALARADIDPEGEDLGEPDATVWFPDRTWNGRTYVPATARTSTGFELYGYVSYALGDDGPGAFTATADFTSETAEANPDWRLDLCDEVVGAWRGEQGNVADMTLVWGVPLVDLGALVTAELADLAVDQCEVHEGRFTLVAADSYRGDTLEIKLFDAAGRRLAIESLYEDDGED